MEKFWIKELNLLEQDREILLNPAGELTDSIIDAAQTLLKQAFPQLCGLQSVSCGLTMTFDIEPSEFVQVLNNGMGHWLTISTIGTTHPSIHTYDSMYPSVGTKIKSQIFQPFTSNMNVQMQVGGYDCGLFALAYAIALAQGMLPYSFHLDQPKMRRHLWKCFQKRKIVRFPYTKLRRATESTVKSVDEVRVYCTCRMPELPDTKWIECSRCKNWIRVSLLHLLR